MQDVDEGLPVGQLRLHELRRAVGLVFEDTFLFSDSIAANIAFAEPDSDPAEVELLKELGYRSLLMLPISCAGRAIGLFEAYSAAGRPFSRFEIGRARIIALQVGATLERISRR